MLTQEIELTGLDTETDQTSDVHGVDLKTFNSCSFPRDIGDTMSDDDVGAWCW